MTPDETPARGEVQGPLDLSLFIALETNHCVGVIGSPEFVSADLERRGAAVTLVDARRPRSWPAMAFDHLVITQVRGGLSLETARQASQLLQPGGSVLLRLRSHAPLHREGVRAARSLERAGFQSIHVYGAYPILPGLTTLVSLAGAAPARTFLRDVMIPYSLRGALLRRAGAALLSLGMRSVLFRSVVVTARHAA